jgi:membrane fusion protein (multidrug efflux system)
VNKDEVSRQQYDTALATATAASATVDAGAASAKAAQQMIAQRRAALDQALTQLSEAEVNAPKRISIQRSELATREANVRSAEAQLEQALLNLSYCKILAPVSGVVGRRTVEVGNRIQPGEQLLYITQLDDLWVTANFKETQLNRMKPGQRAVIAVDALGGRRFEGYVESMPGASGARFSLLPPENATGNYVKVVQRLPVRIRLKPGQDPDRRLRPGMSVGPKVWLN